MEGTDGGVGNGGRLLRVPDLLRRMDEGGEGLGAGPGADALVCKGSGVMTGAFAGGVGSFRGERGCGDTLKLRSLPITGDAAAGGMSTYCTGADFWDKEIVAKTISCKSE